MILARIESSLRTGDGRTGAGAGVMGAGGGGGGGSDIAGWTGLVAAITGSGPGVASGNGVLAGDSARSIGMRVSGSAEGLGLGRGGAMSGERAATLVRGLMVVPSPEVAGAEVAEIGVGVDLERLRTGLSVMRCCATSGARTGGV